MRQVSLVAALGRNRVIGKNGKLPWKMPADMKHFRAVTMGKPMVMGRKTYESIGRPLPGRESLVLTRDPNFEAPGCKIVRSLDEVVELTPNAQELCVIGGEAVYELFMPIATMQRLTFIAGDFEGDAFYPRFAQEEWEEFEREDFPADAENPHPYCFVTLVRKS